MSNLKEPLDEDWEIKNKVVNEEKLTKKQEYTRISKLLISKVRSNQAARHYYSQIKGVLEDILMLELAQKAAEITIIRDTMDGVINVDENSLIPFRREMERVKLIKLTASLFPLSGAPQVEETVSNLIYKLYGPETNKKLDSASKLYNSLWEDYISNKQNYIKKKVGKNE